MLFGSHTNQAGMEECRAGRRLTQANQPCANDPRTEPGIYSFIVPSEMCLHHFNWNNNKNPQRLHTLKCGLLRLPLMPLTLFLTYSNYFEAFFSPLSWGNCLKDKKDEQDFQSHWKMGKQQVRDPGPCQVPRLSLVAMTCGDEHNSLIHLRRQKKYLSLLQWGDKCIGNMYVVLLSQT